MVIFDILCIYFWTTLCCELKGWFYYKHFEQHRPKRSEKWALISLVFWPFCDLSYNQQSIEVNSGAALDSLSPIFLDDAQQPTVHSKRVQCLEMNHYRIDLGQPRAIFPRQLQISSPIVNQLWLIFKRLLRIFYSFFSFDTC